MSRQSARGVIAVDWGTTRFRAYRLDTHGAVQDRVASDDGMASIIAGGFPAVLDRLCGAWMAADAAVPVLLAGMVGSRNGWAEAAYAACPASPASVAAATLRLTERIAIVPGVIARGPTGPDVMRGEETLIFGAGIADGLVCLPGTHSKWAEVAGGAITDFASFMTGESYALYRHHSLLGRLAVEPDDAAGFAEGLAAAKEAGGLLNRLFQARTRVLDNRMSGAMVGPYLSGLLIGAEIDGAFTRYGHPDAVRLVADGILAASYGKALEERGVSVQMVTPEAAFIAGLSALAKVHED